MRQRKVRPKVALQLVAHVAGDYEIIERVFALRGFWNEVILLRQHECLKVN